MKSQSNNYFTAEKLGEFNCFKSTTVLAKKPKYIYTEEDLGVGILDVGVPA